MTESNRKPRSIDIDDATAPSAAKEESRTPRSSTRLSKLEPVPDDAAQGIEESLTPPPAKPVKRGVSWASLLLTALGALVSLGVGLAVDQLIRDLFERTTWLGWLAAAFAALAVVAALAITLRELLAIMRMRAIVRLAEMAVTAREDNDGKLARKFMHEMVALYAHRPETAYGRASLAAHRNEVIDGADLVDLTERDLLAPLDRQARSMVMNSAKRVSIVTAVSPRALVDIAFVLMENMRLIRRLSQLYGGRPGTLGFFRLARNVLAHLATTGAISIGDGLLQQMVGHGLAAKLSARLGEGVVNGLLTARIGIAAIDVCRPMPFAAQKRPGIADFLGELTRLGSSAPPAKAGDQK